MAHEVYQQAEDKRAAVAGFEVAAARLPPRLLHPPLVTPTYLSSPPPHPTTHLQLERAQQTLLGVIAGVEGRGKGGLTPEQQAAFDEAVAILEADGGVEVGAALAAGYQWKEGAGRKEGVGNPDTVGTAARW